MALREKYLNPFTDFGFKKLFGSEPNKELLIDFLNQLLPPEHQIQDLTYARNEQMGRSEFDRRAERAQYEESIKVYRDLKNVIDTAAMEAAAKGEAKKAIEVARKALRKNMPLADIAELTGLSEEEIAALQSPS